MKDSKQPNKVKALGLCSGGLDSMLAGMVLKEQGIDVTWVSFETPFFSADKARRASHATGIPLIVRPIFSIYMEMLKDPPAGYGQYMNPCMDCHALMFQLAGELMVSKGFNFLFSGEVLGQRPMSQTFPSLRYVAKRSGMDGLILRPLSALRLPKTIPEQKGWVDRDRLLDFIGRSRKPQMKLASKYGLTDYPAPAGGCLLTDKGYTNRLRDLFVHQKEATEDELHLLKYGRHFRLTPQTKIIVGRTKKDNDFILRHRNAERDTLLKTMRYPGPTTLIPRDEAPEKIIKKAAAICAGYTKAPVNQPVEVLIMRKDRRRTLRVVPLPTKDSQSLLLR